MFTSIKLGSPFGISVYIHPAFWLLPIFYLFSNLRATSLFHSILEVVLLFAVFFCVILHEFGHALAARMFGIQTRDITIYPMGGVARLERMSEDPFEELVIALAGPAVNLLIFFLLLPICIYFSAASFDFEHLNPPNNLSGSLKHYMQMLMFSNLGLMVFNLLPIFPMDGGRVLRALLNLAVGFSNATIASVFLGNLGAIVLVFLGLFSSNYILVLLAFFVFIAGRQELIMLRNKRNIGSNSNFTSSGPSTFSSLTWDSQRKTWVYFDANQHPPSSNNS